MSYRHAYRMAMVLLLFAIVGVYYYVWQGVEAFPAKQPPSLLLSDEPLHLEQRVKSVDCQVNGSLSDPACTPGAVFADADTDTICVSGYTKTVRNVPVSLKKQIYAEYGLTYPQATGAYEADHLIPLELGGNNDIANLFPEAAEPRPGFHEKDLVENYLHKEVCDGRVNLAAAQQQIATDWTEVYQALSPYQIWELRQQFN